MPERPRLTGHILTEASVPVQFEEGATRCAHGVLFLDGGSGHDHTCGGFIAVRDAPILLLLGSVRALLLQPARDEPGAVADYARRFGLRLEPIGRFGAVCPALYTPSWAPAPEVQRAVDRLRAAYDRLASSH